MVGGDFKVKKLNLLDNAMDSLRVGIDFFDNEKLATARKHSILSIFHSIELLLKEKLARISPVLIYRDAHLKKISEKSKTLGFSEILILFNNLNIEISAVSNKSLRHI